MQSQQMPYVPRNRDYRLLGKPSLWFQIETLRRQMKETVGVEFYGAEWQHNRADHRKSLNCFRYDQQMRCTLILLLYDPLWRKQ